MNTTRVLIAGYGQMGHAMETLLAPRAAPSIWPTTPQDCEPDSAIRGEAAHADLLVICTPTVAHAAVLRGLAYLLKRDATILSIAKGLDSTGRCAADILEAHWGGRSWGVLGGPMIANEIITGRSAFAELGSHDADLLRPMRELFAPGLSIAGIADPRAISWCGVLKNIYSPLVGVADELGWGDNARGHIVMAALREMHAILTELTGDGGQAYRDAGLADFVTTVTSPSSHHYALGRRVARGDYGNLECEAVHSLQVLLAGARVDPKQHQLLGIAAHLVGECAMLPKSLHAWLTAP